MLIEKTVFSIRKEGETYTAFRGKEIASKGFSNINSALKSIHVLEGSKDNEFYSEVDTIVLKNTKIKKEG